MPAVPDTGRFRAAIRPFRQQPPAFRSGRRLTFGRLPKLLPCARENAGSVRAECAPVPTRPAAPENACPPGKRASPTIAHEEGFP